MEKEKAIKIVFMGSPDFAIPTLEALKRNYTIAGIVTQPDRPAGRGRKLQPPAVKSRALELELPFIQPVRLKDPETKQQVYEWNPDLIVVTAYGQILKTDVLEIPRYGCLNVHASLLPRWRGAAPIQAAILHGDDSTGVSIMLMDEGMDTGPVLSQRSIAITREDTGGSLSKKLSKLGAEQLVETLPAYLAGSIKPQIQDDTQATSAPMLKKKDGELDFRKPALELERQVRALNPWPGTYMKWDDQYFKIQRASPVEETADEKKMDPIPGKRGTSGGFPCVQTGSGILVLEVVQPAGKKPMSGKDFLSGSRDWPGDSEH